MNYKNITGPQVRRLRFVRGWSQADLAVHLQVKGLDISRVGVSKIEARIHHIDDYMLPYIAETLKVHIMELFPRRDQTRRLYDFMLDLDRSRY